MISCIDMTLSVLCSWTSRSKSGHLCLHLWSTMTHVTQQLQFGAEMVLSLLATASGVSIQLEDLILGMRASSKVWLWHHDHWRTIVVMGTLWCDRPLYFDSILHHAWDEMWLWHSRPYCYSEPKDSECDHSKQSLLHENAYVKPDFNTPMMWAFRQSACITSPLLHAQARAWSHVEIMWSLWYNIQRLLYL